MWLRYVRYGGWVDQSLEFRAARGNGVTVHREMRVELACHAGKDAIRRRAHDRRGPAVLNGHQRDSVSGTNLKFAQTATGTGNQYRPSRQFRHGNRKRNRFRVREICRNAADIRQKNGDIPGAAFARAQMVEPLPRICYGIKNRH